MLNIAFTGGGTGGHIYPGLAVAAQLKKLLTGREYRLFWIGSSAGMDRSLVENAGIEFFGVPSGKLRRYFSLRTIIDFFKVAGGFFAARKILKKNKTVFLFSKGGFVSVPPCVAAASLKIPVFTHESDYSPGLATRINSRFVKQTGRIFTAYEDTARFFNEKIRDRITVSGNPVREDFRFADSAKGKKFLGIEEDSHLNQQFKQTPRILLILGGSQGAKEINDLVRESLDELIKIYTVVHQTGPNLNWDIPESEKYKPFPYIKEKMPHVMAAAELVMGRSGAGIWEWAVLGKPMLLIPLRGSGTRGDQIENARFFENAKAARVLLPQGGSGDKIDVKELISAVNEIAHNDKKRSAMAAASAKIGEKDGAQIIAQILFNNIAGNGGGVY